MIKAQRGKRDIFKKKLLTAITFLVNYIIKDINRICKGCNPFQNLKNYGYTDTNLYTSLNEWLELKKLM